MGKKVNKQALYARPLPIVLSNEKYGEIPECFPHNPVSWLIFSWKFLRINYCSVPPHSEFPRVEVKFEDGIFKCTDDMDVLWRNGFFGKGTLSRSEPTWKERTIERLGLDPEARKSNQLSMEDLTSRRRDERKKFKSERSKLKELETKQRRGDLTSEEIKTMEQLTMLVSTLRNQEKLNNGDEAEVEISAEDAALFDPETRQLYRNLEFLQLQPVEAFYLAFALDCIRVEGFDLESLFYACVREDRDTSEETAVTPNCKFLLDYVVYHHFRSLGWCVRSGIKFGTEFLLYKRGPPFTHAEFAIMVIPNDKDSNLDWFQMASIGRVIGTVKKNLVLVYVDYPDQETMQGILSSGIPPKEMLMKLFGEYKVTEVLYRRWAPGRTRG